uniref:Transmembrane protein 82 n=1 Tax=Echeneis naucrates TaxID=173247 RepID=A0A665T5A6_ECHNA
MSADSLPRYVVVFGCGVLGLFCFISKGLVGACGISVLCSLTRVYHFNQTWNWKTTVQFWSLTLLLSAVGSRASSLIVLEFSLRAVSAWLSDADSRGLDLLLIQCQFSLGCCLTCTLDFLHQGAPHSSFSLFLAAALSWALASVGHGLWIHVARLYPLHSTERCCGKCITLLTSGHTILASLQRAVVLVFALATVASTAMVYDHFLCQKDALKLWIPLILCYTMLVVYIQEDQNQQTSSETLMRIVVVRLGALLVLMLTVGNWSDVLHILFTFLGEAVCLLPTQDLLRTKQQSPVTKQMNPQRPEVYLKNQSQ